MSTASAVLRRNDGFIFFNLLLVPMSTASAVLRHLCLELFYCQSVVPMSTASAVLRLFCCQIYFTDSRYLCLPLRWYWDTLLTLYITAPPGTYVYRFGGIETMLSSLLQEVIKRYLCLPLRRYWDSHIIFVFLSSTWYLCLLLRRYWDFNYPIISSTHNLVPMSTASAVLRLRE